MAVLAGLAPAQAQTVPPTPGEGGWQACMATAASDARLACFDQWAKQQPQPAAAGAAAAARGAAAPTAASAANNPPAAGTSVDPLVPATRVISITSEKGCHDPQYSNLSRFWELETGSDCGTFGIRGYRPISVSLIAASSVNTQPTSGNPDNNALAATAYRKTETRLQLSVRTKLAQGLLTGSHPTLKDSLWFGYTQQSYWQLFSGGISRPFRSTDHEPEAIYVYPTDFTLPLGWRVRYSGAGIVHQSNGQALPLSRSWNRLIGGVALERDDWVAELRAWKRITEAPEDDDNPDISDHVGRVELRMARYWGEHALSLQLRHSMRSGSRSRGSAQVDYVFPLAGALHGQLQLFSGYGESLIDYNLRQTKAGLGITIAGWR